MDPFWTTEGEDTEWTVSVFILMMQNWLTLIPLVISVFTAARADDSHSAQSLESIKEGTQEPSWKLKAKKNDQISQIWANLDIGHLSI